MRRDYFLVMAFVFLLAALYFANHAIFEVFGERVLREDDIDSLILPFCLIISLGFTALITKFTPLVLRVERPVLALAGVFGVLVFVSWVTMSSLHSWSTKSQWQSTYAMKTLRDAAYFMPDMPKLYNVLPVVRKPAKKPDRLPPLNEKTKEFYLFNTFAMAAYATNTHLRNYALNNVGAMQAQMVSGHNTVGYNKDDLMPSHEADSILAFINLHLGALVKTQYISEAEYNGPMFNLALIEYLEYDASVSIFTFNKLYIKHANGTRTELHGGNARDILKKNYALSAAQRQDLLQQWRKYEKPEAIENWVNRSAFNYLKFYIHYYSQHKQKPRDFNATRYRALQVSLYQDVTDDGRERRYDLLRLALAHATGDERSSAFTDLWYFPFQGMYKILASKTFANPSRHPPGAMAIDVPTWKRALEEAEGLLKPRSNEGDYYGSPVELFKRNDTLRAYLASLPTLTFDKDTARLMSKVAIVPQTMLWLLALMMVLIAGVLVGALLTEKRWVHVVIVAALLVLVGTNFTHEPFNQFFNGGLQGVGETDEVSLLLVQWLANFYMKVVGLS